MNSWSNWPGSTRLSRIHQTYLVETRMCVHALADTYDTPSDRVTEHQSLASAIRSGDVALTDKLMLAHMEDAVGRLIAGYRPAEVYDAVLPGNCRGNRVGVTVRTPPQIGTRDV